MLEIPEDDFQELLHVLQSMLSIDVHIKDQDRSLITDTVKLLIRKYEEAFLLCKELAVRNVPNTLYDFQKCMYEASEMQSILIRPPVPLNTLRNLQHLHELMDTNLSQWIKDILEIWKD